MQVIQFPVPARYIKHSPELQALNEKKLLKANTMLIPHPYEDGKYIEINSDLSKVAETTLQKARAFSIFCSALGAKEVKFSEAKVSKEEKEVSGALSIISGLAAAAAATATAKLSNAKVEGKHNFKKSIIQKLAATDTYQANPVDYEKAERIATEHWLLNDPLFQDVLRKRKQGIETLHLETVLTSDVSSSIKALADLGVKMPTPEVSAPAKEKSKKNPDKKQPANKRASSPDLVKIQANIAIVINEYEEVQFDVYVKFYNL